VGIDGGIAFLEKGAEGEAFEVREDGLEGLEVGDGRGVVGRSEEAPEGELGGVGAKGSERGGARRGSDL
jgi:hypothetical protein